MTEAARFGDLRRVLAEHADDLLRRLNIGPVNLSLPVDGKGDRIKVSVLPGKETSVPENVEVELDGRHLLVKLQGVGDYQKMRAF
jgi:hypothetical protein